MFYNHPEDKDGVLAFNIVHHPVFYMAHLISSVLLMLLALIEKPSVFAIEEEDASVVCTLIQAKMCACTTSTLKPCMITVIT